MPDSSDNSFLIRRSVIELKVQLLPNGTVSIDPYNCNEKNLRLWRIIARTQTAYAQARLEANNNGSPYSVLLATFDKQGWKIINKSDL